jgi:hypothetical protein
MAMIHVNAVVLVFSQIISFFPSGNREGGGRRMSLQNKFFMNRKNRWQTVESRPAICL